MLVLVGKSKLFLPNLASQARRAREIGWLSDSLFVLSLCVKFFIQFYFRINFWIRRLVRFIVFGDHINTYNRVRQKTGKDRKDINKSVTFARPVFCTFQYLISSCNKCYLIFLYIDATGYWLHLGDFYSSSSCLEVFLIHDERSKHLVKPWMKVTEAMQNNH